MQRRTGRAPRGSIYSNPGVSTHRQQDQQAQQRDVGQPLHDTQNPRKRPHSQLSASTNLLDDEFDDIGSAALSNYEMSQHQGAEPHTHTPFQQSANPPPPAALHYNPYTSTASSSVSGHTSTSSGSEQLPASVCDPTYSTPSVGLSITQAQSAHQQQIAQLENERYRYLGEAKTWRDRFSHEEKIRRDKEQELHSLQESRKLELAAMEKEYTRKLEQLSTQLEFAQKELTDEREKRKASDEKLKHLGGSPSFEQVIRVPPQVVRAKRPKQQYSPASGLLPAFPSTASFMESPSFLVASTPLQFKRPQEMHPAPFDADGRSSMQPSTEARDVTPKPSPLLGALMTHQSVQTPSQSSSMLCVSSSAAVLGRSSFIVPQSEGDVFMVDTVQSNGRFSGAELLQRLVQWNAQETKAGVDSAVSHQDKVIFQPEEDALSPSTDEEEEETEDAERSDSHDAPPMQPDGFFSLMTCLNPFFIAGTSKPIDALLSPRHSTASTSKKGRRALKDNTSLVKAAILQSIGRKRRLVATEDSESSSSDDSSSMKANPSGNMSPFLLDSASQSQLQECVSRLLASAGVPHTTTTSVELCTPLHFGGQHSVHSPVQQHGGEDQGLSLLYFLQSRIIAYCRECTSESSQQGDIGDSLSPTTTDSLAGSDKGTNTSSVSFDGSSVDFYGPLLQLLKTLLLLVQYSPSVREKICESPPCLVYDSILASRPGSRSSGHADCQSESSSCGSKGSSVELLSQKSSLDLSDQLSGRMDSSNEQRQPTSKLGLVASDLRSTSLGGILTPCPSLSKVYTAVSSISATASSSNQPSFSLSERDLSVDVMCHSSLTAQFFPLLLRLAEPPWSDNLPICQCVLDILSHLAPACAPDFLPRLLVLLSDGAFAACLKHGSCDVACAVVQIITSLVQTKGFAELLCSRKNADCLLYKLYMFLCHPPSDTSDIAIAELTSQVLRLMSAVISHVDRGLGLIFYSECDCSIEAPGAILHGVCRHLPLRNGAEVPQPILTSFQEFVSFLDCYAIPDGGDDYIFAIECLLEFFTDLGVEYKREVTALQDLQQEVEQHDDNEGEEEMETQ